VEGDAETDTLSVPVGGALCVIERVAVGTGATVSVTDTDVVSG
jgi:stress response protein YsnF